VKKQIAVIFLTYNSQKIINKSITEAKKISRNIIVVDSFSNDKTIQLCKKHNCKIYLRKFKNYSDQRNWIIKKIKKDFHWQLHLDSDEIPDNDAINSIKIAINTNNGFSYIIKRKNYFLGKKLNFSGLNPWHLRLFKSGKATCENLLYDQHFVSTSIIKKLNGYIHDKNPMNLQEWKKRHLRWAKLEAKNIVNKKRNKKILKGKLNFDPRQRVRFYKNLLYLLPSWIRPYLLFLYRLFIKLAVLDMEMGIKFTYYHSFWFRRHVEKEINKILKKNK